MPPSPYCVVAPGGERPLRQGEILARVVVLRVDPATLGTDDLQIERVEIPFALILTQDCDLEQDYSVRFGRSGSGTDKLLPGILLTEVNTAEDTFARIAAGNQKQWNRLAIQSNRNPRFHFLQRVESGCDRLNEGLPELTIDFKRYFTIPPDELYRRVELGEAVRRCALVSPYLEHLGQRFAAYLSRVGLPTDHASE